MDEHCESIFPDGIEYVKSDWVVFLVQILLVHFQLESLCLMEQLRSLFVYAPDLLDWLWCHFKTRYIYVIMNGSEGINKTSTHRLVQLALGFDTNHWQEGWHF